MSESIASHKVAQSISNIFIVIIKGNLRHTKKGLERVPTMKDYNIPESQAEWDSMIAKINDCDINASTTTGMIRARKSKLKLAILNWNNQQQCSGARLPFTQFSLL